MSRERVTLDVDYLVREYRSGRSVLDLARECGVGRPTVTQRLVKAGVVIRSIGEQNLISFDRIGPERRAAMTKAAHDAVRGVPKNFEGLVKAAITKQRTLSSVSPLETRVMEDLRGRCIDPIPQLAVGPYNCDIACHPVAVEIFGGGWHLSGRHLARAEKRIRYLGDAGWHVLMLIVGINANPYIYRDDTCDYLVSYINEARRNPSARREYRMVDCRGETLAAGGCDDRDVSIKPAFRSRRDLSSGRYERVTG